MKKAALILIVLAAIQGANAHQMSEDDMTPTQVLVMQIQEDLSQSFERASLLQNSIISNEVTDEKKCDYLAELRVLTRKLDYTINEYANVPSDRMTAAFFDHEGDMRKIHAEQMNGTLRSILGSVEIFEKNLKNCN